MIVCLLLQTAEWLSTGDMHLLPGIYGNFPSQITSMQIHLTSYQGQAEWNYHIYSTMQPELPTMLHKCNSKVHFDDLK